MSEPAPQQRNALIGARIDHELASAALHGRLAELGGTQLTEWKVGCMQVVEERDAGGQWRALLGSTDETRVRALATAVAAACRCEVHVWIAFGSARHANRRLSMDCSVDAAMVSPEGEHTSLPMPALDRGTLAYVDGERRTIPLGAEDTDIALARFTSHALHEAAHAALTGYRGGPATTTHYAFAGDLPPRLQSLVALIRAGGAFDVSREADGRWRLAISDPSGKRTSFLRDAEWRTVAHAIGRDPDAVAD